MMLVGTSSAWAATATRLYLNPGSNWKSDGARFAAYFFGNGEKWISMKAVSGETNLYEVDVPSGFPKVIFCRMDPNNQTNGWGSEKWNQTGDLTIPTDGKSYFIKDNNTWNGATTSWSTIYNITYNANGGSGEPSAQLKKNGTDLTLSSTKPTRTGYTFQNWNTKKD
jgi:hypothetical protein